ncbi:MAG: hypothetical protein M1820_004678 [Bogoriella megaspora]|nr:MAG: hypothetical protein M1820_004678 [Bogoriella megaspora]
MPPSRSHPATRKSSRTSSPAVQTRLNFSPAPNVQQKEQTPAPKGPFVEPPLAPPQPSYKDDKLFNQGVLTGMMPLGTMPPKSRLRIKDGLGQSSNLSKSVEAAETEDTSEATPPVEPRRSESRRPERQASKRTLNVITDDDDEDEYLPKMTTRRSSRTARPTVEERLSRLPTDIGSLESYRALGAIVENCAEHALSLRQPVIASAIRHMYSDWSMKPSIPGVLHAVLSQKPSASDAAILQEYVKQAKKELKPKIPPKKKRRLSTDIDAIPTTEPVSTPLGKLSTKSSLKAPKPTEVTNGNLSITPLLESSSPIDEAISNDRKAMAMNGTSTPPPQALERAGSSPLSSTHSDDFQMMESSTALNDVTSASPPAQEAPKISAAAKPKKAQRASLKIKKKPSKRDAAVAELEDDPFDDERQARKRALTQDFRNHFELSDIRAPPVGVPPPATAQSSLLQPIGGILRFNGIQASGSSLPASGDISRHGTPGGANRPARKAPTARFKMSPEKKKTGAPAAIGRVGGGLASPLGEDGRDESASDNDDYCTACSGGGYLLCCDGCDNAFHFSCLDPPRKKTDPIFQNPWYCSDCMAKKEAPQQEPRGLFQALLQNIDKRNAKTFQLPKEIRDFFEGVRTGEDGVFQAEKLTKTQNKNRTGWADVTPDYTKLKDSKDRPILCYSCNKSSLGGRPIIPCDVCGKNWHLDCLDPPRANPPVLRDNEGWKCPLHSEQDLAAIPVTHLRQPERNNRTIRMRKPKKPTIVDTSLRRGLINNGLIDIEMESSDEEGDFYEEDGPDGIVYRVPEHSIKLDFIDKVKLSRAEAQSARLDAAVYTSAQPKSLTSAQPVESQLSSESRKRSFAEVKTALNMAQMSGAASGLESTSATDRLIAAMIAEAPQEVVDRMGGSNISTLSALTATGGAPLSPAPSTKLPDLTALTDDDLNTLMAFRDLVNRITDKAVGRQT